MEDRSNLLVRTARLDGFLSNHLASYSREMADNIRYKESTIDGRFGESYEIGFDPKYFLDVKFFEDSCLPGTENGQNLSLAILSHSEENGKKVFHDFQRKTGIDFTHAPEEVEKRLRKAIMPHSSDYFKEIEKIEKSS